MSDKPVNLRKARAGIELIANPNQSLKQALVKSGYAESTAKKPTANGLTAKHCLQEATKLDPSLEPAKLVQGARKLFKTKIDQALADPSQVARAKFADIARFLEVAEKSYTIQDGEDLGARQFVDRLSWLAELQAELEARNGPKDR